MLNVNLSFLFLLSSLIDSLYLGGVGHCKRRVLNKAEVEMFVNPFRCERASECLNKLLRFFVILLVLTLWTYVMICRVSVPQRK